MADVLEYSDIKADVKGGMVSIIELHAPGLLKTIDTFTFLHEYRPLAA